MLFMKQFNRAAAFGIDARITIIIMAILAGLSFYIAQNVIHQYQEQSFVDQVDTLRNAARQNIIDNGLDFAIDAINANDNLFGVSDVDPATLISGRNKYSYITEPDFASIAETGIISTPSAKISVNLKNLFTSTAETGVSALTTDCANTSATCYYWIELSNVLDENYALLENYYDGDVSESDAETTGIVVIPGQVGRILIKVGER